MSQDCRGPKCNVRNIKRYVRSIESDVQVRLCATERPECRNGLNGHDVPIDLDRFSSAIMSGRQHAEVHLQFGRHDGITGRSNLHVWKTDPGQSVLGAWLYELGTIAVSVMYVQADRFEHRRDLWHPRSPTSSKRFQIADFMYSKRDESELAGSANGAQAASASGSGPQGGSDGPSDSLSVLAK
jgi:hypothetical protein